MASKAPRRQTEPPADMLSVEEALAQILALVERMPVESQPLTAAQGQVLAEDLEAITSVKFTCCSVAAFPGRVELRGHLHSSFE